MIFKFFINYYNFNVKLLEINNFNFSYNYLYFIKILKFNIFLKYYKEDIKNVKD